MGTKPHSGRPEKLTPKQEAFVREYLVDLNATQAAKRAGYRGSDKTLSVVASKMLAIAKISSAVDAVRSKRAEKLDIDKEWVMRGLVKNYNRAMQAEEVTDREGNGTGVFVYAGQVANRALELLGKELGMFVERQEHSGPGGAPLKTDLTLKIPSINPDEVLAILRQTGAIDRAQQLRAAALAPQNGNGNGNGHASG